MPEPSSGAALTTDDALAAYRTLWDGWLADGWRVVSCAGTDRAVTLRGADARDADGAVRVVHEHLSAPSTGPSPQEESA